MTSTDTLLQIASRLYAAMKPDGVVSCRTTGLMMPVGADIQVRPYPYSLHYGSAQCYTDCCRCNNWGFYFSVD